MKRSLLSFGLAYILTLNSTAQTFYKDLFGDQHNTSTGWVTHRGQKLGTDMDPAERLEAYGEGYGWDIWLMDKSMFKVSMILQDTLAGNNDTTLCVSVEAHGPRVDKVSPEPYFRLPGLSNFYYPHCGLGALDVRSYHREVYWETWPRISMQLYTSSSGPKLAFVCEPGSDPTEIELKLVGQDSLHLDVSGIEDVCARELVPIRTGGGLPGG